MYKFTKWILISKVVLLGVLLIVIVVNFYFNTLLTVVGIGLITVVNISVSSYITISIGKRSCKTPTQQHGTCKNGRTCTRRKREARIFRELIYIRLMRTVLRCRFAHSVSYLVLPGYKAFMKD